MQKQTKHSWLLICIALFLAVTLFGSIRFFEKSLFYDPLLQYFKGDYRQKPFPEMDLLRWCLSTFSRFLLNTSISLGLLWFLFRDKEIIKLLSVIYALAFMVLMSVLLALLLTKDPSNMLIFYLRRFLIQPIFLMLFIPAIYFHLRVISKK